MKDPNVQCLCGQNCRYGSPAIQTSNRGRFVTRPTRTADTIAHDIIIFLPIRAGLIDNGGNERNSWPPVTSLPMLEYIVMPIYHFLCQCDVRAVPLTTIDSSATTRVIAARMKT